MEPGDRLKLAREARGYATAAEFARRFAIGESIHTHRENKTRGISRKAAIWYASILKISLDWLLSGTGSMDGRKRLVPLGGYIGAGAEVIPIDDSGGRGLEDVEPPPDAGPDVVAYKVRGDSMYPAYSDGDLVYQEGREQAHECVGLECIVDLPDGRRLLKVLAKGPRKGTYTLLSHNAPPIADVPLDWVYPVSWVKRARHRRTVSPAPTDLPVLKIRKSTK